MRQHTLIVPSDEALTILFAAVCMVKANECFGGNKEMQEQTVRAAANLILQCPHEAIHEAMELMAQAIQDSGLWPGEARA